MRRNYQQAAEEADSLQYEVVNLRNYVKELKQMLKMMLDPTQTNERVRSVEDQFLLDGDTVQGSP
jgi:hypothetical protein